MSNKSLEKLYSFTEENSLYLSKLKSFLNNKLTSFTANVPLDNSCGRRKSRSDSSERAV